MMQSKKLIFDQSIKSMYNKNKKCETTKVVADLNSKITILYFICRAKQNGYFYCLCSKKQIL